MYKTVKFEKPTPWIFRILEDPGVVRLNGTREHLSVTGEKSSGRLTWLSKKTFYLYLNKIGNN